MRTKLINVNGEVIVILPYKVLNELGWKIGDEVIVDIPSFKGALPQAIIHKVDKND